MKTEKTSFDEFYRLLYGERWEGLKKALLCEPTSTCLRIGLKKPYFLDEASVLSAQYLQANSEDRILDCCAAPGGKSLAILSQLLAPMVDSNPIKIDNTYENLKIHMTVNDRSTSRRMRLKRVLSEHLPQSIADQITLSGHDAGRWGSYEPETYDKIILDVPCSSERHLLAKPKYLKQWSSSRSRRLAQQAYCFLLSCLTALKPGGSLVYVTCALTPAENDNVIIRALEWNHRKGFMNITVDNQGNSRHIMLGEKDQHYQQNTELPHWVECSQTGFMVLPDRAEGRGPIFFSRLLKN